MAFDFDSYWRENGDKIQDKRNNRYQNDPEYAARQRKWSADYRAKKKRERALVGRRPLRHNMRRPIQARIEGLDGACDHDIVCLNLGSLARIIGRSKQMILDWEAGGFLPRSPLRDKYGRPLYTLDMVAAINAAVSARKRVFQNDNLLYYEVLWRWNRSGVAEMRNGNIVYGGVSLGVPLPNNAGVLLTVNGFARSIGRSIGTIRNWERNKVIPDTPFRYGDQRFYPQGISADIKSIIRGRTIRYTDTETINQIWAYWTAEINRLCDLGIERLV